MQTPLNNSREMIYGKHPVMQVLLAARRKCFQLSVQNNLASKYSAILELAMQKKIKVMEMPPSFFDRQSSGQKHQGLLLEAASYPYQDVTLFFSRERILVLDGLEDPHNFGALCRSAYLLGFEGVVLPRHHSVSVGPGALQSSVGALEWLDIAQVTNISRTLEQFKEEGFWIYGADQEASKQVDEEKFGSKTILVIGNEESGLRPLVKKNCDVLIQIPMKPSSIGSLNASVSGSLLMYEVTRGKLSSRCSQ